MITIGLFAIFIIFCAGLALVKSYEEYSKAKRHALNPTAGIVGATNNWAGSSTPVDDTWTTLLTITIPNVDHEDFFISAAASIDAAPGVAYGICGRLYDVTDDIYYPINDSDAIQQSYRMPNVAYVPATFFFTIPKDVKNHTIEFQIKHSIGSTKSFLGTATSWGHSPHTHR